MHADKSQERETDLTFMGTMPGFGNGINEKRNNYLFDRLEFTLLPGGILFSSYPRSSDLIRVQEASHD